ncbi:MAG: alpha/beta hydrolase, partial [Candidatus Methanomethylophilaceae archaeon]|nr:alpha/beta hydrolase [Candidatus Methanomethylophilaceae archaeon]
MMYEERVFVDGKVKLGATVTYPDRDKKNPAVVIIMGTGSLDRDGNARGMHTDLYRNMAAMFNGFGYATIRYDKRGTHESGKGDGVTGLYDLVDDASSIIQYMRSLPFVDENSVIVCGHSEGAIIATLLSERESVSGLILIGGAAMSIKDALY